MIDGKSTKDFLELRTPEADRVRGGSSHSEAIGVPFDVVVSADDAYHCPPTHVTYATYPTHVTDSTHVTYATHPTHVPYPAVKTGTASRRFRTP